jgi:hypothetical protein
MTLAVPVCLCHGAANDKPASQPIAHHHHGDDDDGDGDHGAPAHPGCPGHDKKSESCGCPDMTAALSKSWDFAKALPIAAVVPHPILAPLWAVFPARTPAAWTLTKPAIRPANTLLRQHCALIV